MVLIWSKHTRCLDLWKCLVIAYLLRRFWSVYYMFLKMGFDGTIELSCIGLTIRTGNLVNSLVDNWVIFVFSTFEKLF